MAAIVVPWRTGGKARTTAHVGQCAYWSEINKKARIDIYLDKGEKRVAVELGKKWGNSLAAGMPAAIMERRIWHSTRPSRCVRSKAEPVAPSCSLDDLVARITSRNRLVERNGGAMPAELGGDQGLAANRLNPKAALAGGPSPGRR